jgi:uncharacterized protein YdeI (YjbR/CyaY-like superfamily)
MGKQDDAERFEPASLADWSDWLGQHHDDTGGVWLVTAKRSSGRQPFDYDAGVVEALRFGWVDSTQRPVDEERNMMWFSPRRPASGWSRSNKLRIARLEEEGRLEPAGRAAVDAARANGAWELFDSVEALEVPDDLAAALTGVPGGREQWEAFPPSARKQMLAWIAQARRPETRARRVRDTADRAGRGERAR